MGKLLGFPEKYVRKIAAARASEAAELCSQAIKLEEAGQIARAKELYRAATETDPMNAVAHINLGTIYYNEPSYVLAETHYRRALAIDPNYALAHFDLANTLETMGRLSEAVEEYKAIIRITPSYADAHYNLALVYERLDEQREALAHWQRYVQLDTHGAWHDHAKKQIEKIGNQFSLRVVQ
jgi:tetratricopeptide (TPR) repeat protein